MCLILVTFNGKLSIWLSRVTHSYRLLDKVAKLDSRLERVTQCDCLKVTQSENLLNRVAKSDNLLDIGVMSDSLQV